MMSSWLKKKEFLFKKPSQQVKGWVFTRLASQLKFLIESAWFFYLFIFSSTQTSPSLKSTEFKVDPLGQSRF